MQGAADECGMRRRPSTEILSVCQAVKLGQHVALFETQRQDRATKKIHLFH